MDIHYSFWVAENCDGRWIYLLYEAWRVLLVAWNTNSKTLAESIVRTVWTSHMYVIIRELTHKMFSITVPPENIMILDDKGTHIPHYILGPYNEGELYILSGCCDCSFHRFGSNYITQANALLPLFCDCARLRQHVRHIAIW